MNSGVRRNGDSNSSPSRLLLHAFLFLWSKQCRGKQTADPGITLVEVLVAILITGFVFLASLPPIILSTATRIQNQRAEQALFLAQRELDQVRVTVEGRDYDNSELPKVGASKPSQLATVSAPTSLCTNPCTPSGATQAKEEGDFFIQVFRDTGISDPNITDSTGNQRVLVFRVGVRVYTNAAKKNLGSLDTTPAALTMTNGIGEQGTKPLAVLYSDFAQSEYTRSLERYRNFLQ